MPYEYEGMGPDQGLPEDEALPGEGDDSLDDLYDLPPLPDAKTRPESEPAADEPLFAALLRHSIQQMWPDDAVMADFADLVPGPLSDCLGSHAAKGGDFITMREEAGLDIDERYAFDQSLRGHLVNGLLPVLNIACHLKRWSAPSLVNYWDDQTRRLFIAGYTLHDWVKLPGVPEELATHGLDYQTVNPARHQELVEGIFRRWCARLGLDRFLSPVGGAEPRLHDLIYIACNTQVRHGTVLNLSALPHITIHGRALQLTTTLSHLADLISYVGRTPRRLVAETEGVRADIEILSNHTARLVYHHLADNRGVLSNLIHTAALKAMSIDDQRIPFLYAPSGVVYLERQGAPTLPEASAIIEAAIQEVQKTGGPRLAESLTGFRRDGKGLKRADYYDLFFGAPEQVLLGAKAAFRIISSGKSPAAGKRYAKMRDGRWLDPGIDLDLPDGIEVDQLAEWCFFAETVVRDNVPDLEPAAFLLDSLELSDLKPAFESVPRDNRAGGVGYHWYFAAGHFRKRNLDKDPAQWEELVNEIAKRLASILAARDQALSLPRGSWQELRDYIGQVLSLGPGHWASGVRDRFVAELLRYQDAKRTGRGRTAVCGLCSSPFDTTKQQETAILFAPQVYSNKLPLHGATAIRDICPICGLEMMLRQLLMNRTAASGTRFEGRQVRYLYFYPTYFFTPETLEVFRYVYGRLQNISFTELRRYLLTETGPEGENGSGQLRLDTATLQRLQGLMLSADSLSPNDGRDFWIRFPRNEPVTFFFLGIPAPGRDARDAESWVHPAFLALLLPLCLDVKVVASASSLPLLQEADDMRETVFLDGAHSFVGYLAGKERINVDRVLPTLRRLIVAYLVHLDANSRQGRGGWDYRWSEIPPLARDLDTDPAYACYHLRRWQRRFGLDSIPEGKALQYREFIDYLGGAGKNAQDDKPQRQEETHNTMTHADNLVHLSRKFYRPRRYNSNSILRPLTVAAHEGVFVANPQLFDREALTQVVIGQLSNMVERVQGGDADGYLPRGSNAQSRGEAIQEFARYFVEDIFHGTLRGDVSALRGRQFNLLRSAYEVAYRAADAHDRRQGTELEADEAEDQSVAPVTDTSQ